MSNFNDRIGKLENAGGGRARIEVIPACLTEEEAKAYSEHVVANYEGRENVIFVQTGVPGTEDEARAEKFRQERNKK